MLISILIMRLYCMLHFLEGLAVKIDYYLLPFRYIHNYKRQFSNTANTKKRHSNTTDTAIQELDLEQRIIYAILVR
jgi:hypothetical protein